jgi:GxxExxY protein
MNPSRAKRHSNSSDEPIDSHSFRPGPKISAYPEEGRAIVGACFEVFKDKGFGFPKAFYCECVDIEFQQRNIPSRTKPSFQLSYKGTPVETRFVPDFLCYGKILVEVISVPEIDDQHRWQMQNHLRAIGSQLGLIANYGEPTGFRFERITYVLPRP